MHDLNDMFLFTEVLAQGSFSAAARQLDMPPSRLSRRISRLESDLGVRLLQRTTRNLSLTSAGEVFLQHCQAMRADAEAAYAAVAQAQQEPRGLLRVSCPVTLSQTVLDKVFAEYLNLYPLVDLDLEVSNRVVDPVADGIDVALRVRSSVSDSGSYVVKRFTETNSTLVASPALIQRFNPLQHPDELASLPTVAMGAIRGHSVFELYGPTKQLYEVRHRPRYLATDLLTLKQGIEAGVGVGLLPDYMCSQAVAQGRLQKVLPEWAPLPGIIHAVFPTRQGMAPAVRRLLDLLAERLPALHP